MEPENQHFNKLLDDSHLARIKDHTLSSRGFGLSAKCRTLKKKIVVLVPCKDLILFLKVTASISVFLRRGTLSREGEKFKHTPQ